MWHIKVKQIGRIRFVFFNPFREGSHKPVFYFQRWKDKSIYHWDLGIGYIEIKRVSKK